LGLKNEECLAFEDTVNGTKSAKAAGIICFAIQQHIQEHDKLVIADQVFQNFEMAKNYIIINNILSS
jgi:beta-phosphoglucomutase